ncbi:hypothetical protein MLD38_026528 [Melastoma candidum]|uniref:Uncharacterized protein n=1 Tax=Melastoma candidum TaxID=119954 RepID=A0ACB9P241_9MYRT|nr:hypothetical protein MLD38_026528 [Melastoma candidum]
MDRFIPHLSPRNLYSEKSSSMCASVSCGLESSVNGTVLMDLPPLRLMRKVDPEDMGGRHLLPIDLCADEQEQCR